MEMKRLEFLGKLDLQKTKLIAVTALTHKQFIMSKEHSSFDFYSNIFINIKSTL